ncbi:alpha/beta hydrolase [Undibacterium sp. KW1]|uniref:alpha/beta hydrolase family protein n=1 Tax=Undibacterium sp. KW1 TaxID=2058624 RepID=UPI001331D5A6|nr:alpha/beta fold hydrolase [Undibacterium sp. KW1]BBB62640.1 alpha/beta hydrolase [Undibacterium sp. KW1]
MKKLLITCGTLFALSASLPAFAEDPVGDWTGSIEGMIRLNIFFTKTPSGQHEVNIISPDDDKETIKADKVEARENFMRFSIAKYNANYEAKWDETQKAWLGTWTQGQSLKLKLTRLDAEALAAQTQRRPQEEAIAKSPRNYSSKDVSFQNAKVKISLAGTLTLPQGKGPFPAVVLVHGSGPNDRDETIKDHKFFLVLADHLSTQGIAVLRYDKRGIAASTGDYKSATTFDFADDAQAAVDYLRTHSEINQDKLGVIGHSEGGLIAPMLAANNPKLKFIVLMAGPGVRTDAVLLEQSRLTLLANGESQAEVEKAQKVFREAYSIMNSGADNKTISERLKAYFDQAEKNGDLDKGAGAKQLSRLERPWFRAFIKYDPAPTLAKVKQATLVLNGELDLQVPAKMNLDGIRANMKANKNVVIKELPKLNHLFQTATTGSSAEYGKIDETLSPTALEAMSGWILQQ